MAIPDFQTLMLPVLRLAASGETTLGQCVDRIAQQMSIGATDLEARLQDGRTPILYNRVAWAKTHLRFAGLLESPRRGHFIATKRGRDLLAESPDRIDMRLLRRYPEWLEFRGHRPQPEGEPVTLKTPLSAPAMLDADDKIAPLERMEVAARELASGLRADLLDAVYRAGAKRLEDTTNQLMLKMGYGGERPGAGRRVGGSGDGGVDVVINEDALGLGIVCVQCKCYARDRAVDVPEVRDFAGALDGRHVKRGVFVTTSRFTEPARRFASRLGDKKIVLLDGDELAAKMIEYGLAVQDERVFSVKRLDTDYFSIDEQGGA